MFKSLFRLRLDNYIKDINRIKSLLAYAVIDTPSEEFYDTLNSLVSTICNTPIALISFIDDRRQWYKSKIGMDMVELPVEETICQYTLKEPDILEITDTLQDDRLTENPHVQAENGIRFYAGVSLRAKDGYAIGSVCAADFKPQQLSEMQRQALRDVAKIVMLHLEAKRQNEEMEHELRTVLTEKIELSEKQLQVQDKVYNSLLQAISQSNAVIEFSVDGTILSVNNQLADMLGYSPEELVGQKHSLLLKQDLNPEEQDYFWKKLAAGEPFLGKLKRKNKQGDTIWVQSSYSPVIDLDGNITKITNISIDITNDIKAVDALEELSIQKDHFIANISHELRSPIHAILGFTELLLEKETDNSKTKQLQSVKNAGDSLLYLVNGILDLSKIEAGLFQFDSAVFNLDDTVENVFSILQVKADQKQLQFGYTIDPKIPDHLLGDKHRLSQILINLVDNALKFTQDGEVKLSVELKKKRRKQTELIFRVSDTGIGIPEDKLESIFGRFTQAEENTTRKYGGTGLGLNICKLLVERQGGTIFATSETGKGTEFTFELAFDIAEEQQETESSGATDDYTQLRGRILMCEDNQINRFFAQQLFSDTLVELDIAEDGKAGIELFQQKTYDLVLMDIQMPEMDGYQATEFIRNELHSPTPIIALTAHSIVKEKETCLEIGMNDYLSKPFRKAELFDKIKFWVPQENMESTVVAPVQFSLAILKEASGGNEAFEKQMLELFLINSQESLNLISAAREHSDYTAISREAHKLKTSFGMFGMDTSTLDQLEKHTESIDLMTTIQKLGNQLNEIHSHIHNLLK